MTDVAIRPHSFAPTNLSEAMEFSKLIANSSFVPDGYRGKPGDILVAVQMGAELGLSPMAALQSISVINGRPSVWGDGALALVRGSGLLDDFEEKIVGTGDTRAGYCRMVRKGQATPIVKQFSVADARKANLWDKRGPWQTYPDRMLIMRARGFALRDGFADVLRGIITREEAQDIPPDSETPKPTSDLPWAQRASAVEGTKDDELEETLAASLGTSRDAAPVVAVADPAETSLPDDSDVVSEGGAAPTFDYDEPILINRDDQVRLHAARSEGKHGREETKAWLAERYGITSTSEVHKDWLASICARLRDKAPL